MANIKQSFLFSMWKKQNHDEEKDISKYDIPTPVEEELPKREPVENMPFRWKTSLYEQLQNEQTSNSDDALKESLQALGELYDMCENDSVDGKEEAVEGEDKDESTPKDAEPVLSLDNIKMSAVLTVKAPQNGGKDISEEEIEEVLKDNNVIFGVFPYIIKDIVKFKLYDRPYKIAVGEEPLNGQNGKVIDFYPRKKELKFASRSDGSFDFKDSNIICNIEKGTVICELVEPTTGVDGMNVCGTVLVAKQGKSVELPKGENTAIEDGKLIAAAEGNIFFRDSKFVVQNVFEVRGDVDNGVGNIDFAGDVIVRGNVREGYIIRARGSIVIMGVVEGASLMADGGITIQKGMNGMNKGVIRTKKGLNSKYLENCTAYVKGDVITESIIYSNINCEGEIKAEGKHGAVIGGNIMVYKSLTAKVVGSESNAPTSIVLGVTPEIMNEHIQLQKELETLQEQRRNIEMDIRYLGMLLKKGVAFSPEKQMQIRRLKVQEPINRKRTEQVIKRLGQVEEVFAQVDKAYLSCINIYPGVKLTIGSRVLNITTPNVNCKYMIVNGDIGFVARN